MTVVKKKLFEVALQLVAINKASARARMIVMDLERDLGFEPVDREFEELGYDIESRVPRTVEAPQ
ncbi:MAG: hypothetical protein M5U22_13185 [Thermoleophilia bacterium]|nr:hypothetical protein [Thermoleophilia bacterium]